MSERTLPPEHETKDRLLLKDAYDADDWDTVLVIQRYHNDMAKVCDIKRLALNMELRTAWNRYRAENKILVRLRKNANHPKT